MKTLLVTAPMPAAGQPLPVRCREGRFRRFRAVTALVTLTVLGLTAARAVDFHCVTAQDLQNALTLAAANGADDNIYLTNGYYIGNFNFNSSEARNLTLLPEPGLTNTGITIDGAGGGRALNLSSSGSANTITVQGITFLRNCGNSGIGALRIAAGSSATIVVSGCRFLSPTNTSGMGLEIASGLNATISGCTATGVGNGGGTGISISGVSGNVSVQNCLVSTNWNGLSVGGASFIIISNNMFTGNSASFGGGANINGTTVTLAGNTFSGNSAQGSYGTFKGAGGGAYISGSAVSLIGNSFVGNHTWYGDAGGAYFSAGNLTLTNNIFSGNWAENGGGATCSGTSVTLSGNTFTGNSGSWYGSGGADCSGATVTLSGNTFSGNSGGTGGGANCSGTMVTFSGDTFSGNSATGNGGGAYCSASTALILTGNTLKENAAAYSGGGFYAGGPTVTLLNNLVVHNQQSGSSYKGGGIYVDASSTLNMINNTVVGNTAAGNGGGAAFQVDGVVELLNVFNNIIWGNTATGSGGDVHLAGTGQQKMFEFNDADSMSGVWDIAQNNFDVSPQFFDPVNGDYHIQSTSPCKDAGTNGAPSLPATDLDGGPRIANGTVDLGCYEFNTTATHPADTNANFVLTAAEYAAYAAAWKAGQTWSNAPTVIPADYVTRAGYLMTNGGTYHNDGSARPVNWKIGP